MASTGRVVIPHVDDGARAGATASAPLLDVDGLTVRFGGVTALDQVSFTVDADQICGLIGPNGAGKTTLFNCLSRLYDFQGGDIRFRGQSIRNFPRSKIAPMGIGRTFQNVALFGSMTVIENILVGAHNFASNNILLNALRLPSVVARERTLRAEVEELIELLRLESVRDVEVDSLPFPTRKRVELGRALATRPSLLLLDEPAAGLTHSEVEEFVDLLMHIRRKFRMSVLLVEHHMNVVMRVSDKVVVIDFGKKIADGVPADIQVNPAVIDAYLGKS